MTRAEPPFEPSFTSRRLGARRDQLLEAGRRLASEREDLIADGVDPSVLLIPLATDEDA